MKGTSRALCILQRLSEAYYSSHKLPGLKHADDFLDQVASLLVDNPNDTRPIQMLYAYFIRVKGSPEIVMEPLLQRLGNVLMRDYRASFEEAQTILNLVVRRLAAIGRLRSRQRHVSYGGGSDPFSSDDTEERSF